MATRPIPRRRATLALTIALGVDILQVGLLPLFASGAASPLNDVLDVATALVMASLLGWHAAFLPSFLGELIPFVNLVPTWTAAVLWVTRESKLEGGTGAKPPEDPAPPIRTVENLAERDAKALPPAERHKGN